MSKEYVCVGGSMHSDVENYPGHQRWVEAAPPEAHAEAGERDMRPFPIQDGPTVPWYVMAPHEAQCQKNHSQTLKRIAERGGFGCAEAYAVTHGLEWRELRNDLDGYRKKWFEYAEQFNLTLPAPAANTEGLREALERIKAITETPQSPLHDWLCIRGIADAALRGEVDHTIMSKYIDHKDNLD